MSFETEKPDNVACNADPVVIAAKRNLKSAGIAYSKAVNASHLAIFAMLKSQDDFEAALIAVRTAVAAFMASRTK